MKRNKKTFSAICSGVLAISIVVSSSAIPVSANYTMSYKVQDAQNTNYTPVWKNGNKIANEGINFSKDTVSEMMQKIEDFNFRFYKKSSKSALAGFIAC